MPASPISFRLATTELHERLETRAARHGETPGQYVKRTMERALAAAECAHGNVVETEILVCADCGRHVALVGSPVPPAPPSNGCAHGDAAIISANVPLRRCPSCRQVEDRYGHWRDVPGV